MSRLQQISIPFTAGLEDQSDPKLLPQGNLVDVQNGRLPAVGSLRLRRGWNPLDMDALVSGTLVAEDLYSAGDALVAKCRLSTQPGVQRLAYFVNSNSGRPWRLPASVLLPPATGVRVIGNVPELSGFTAVDTAITNDGVYGAALFTCVAASGHGAQSLIHIFRIANSETVAYTLCGNDSEKRRLLAIGNKFAIVHFFSGSGAVTLDTTDPASTNPGALTALGTLIASGVSDMEAATARETTPTAIHVATLESGTLNYRQFTLAGVQTGSTKAVATSVTGAFGITSDDTHVSCVFFRTSPLGGSFLTFSATSPFTTSSGPSSIGSISVSPSQASIAYDSTQLYAALGHNAFDGINDPAKSFVISRVATIAAHTAVYSRIFDQCTLVGSWLVKAGRAAMGLRYYDQHSVGQSGGYTAYNGMDQAAGNGPWWVDDYGLCNFIDNPQVCYVGQGPTAVALVATFQVLRGTLQPAVRTMQVGDTGRRPACELNDTLYVSGGSMVQFTPGSADGVENGMPPPVLNTITIGGAGNVDAGTHAYRALVSWFDSQHREHFSIVSKEERVTLAGPTVIGFNFAVPATLRVDSSLFTPPTLELYRTEAGPGGPGTVGEVFRLVSSVSFSLASDDTIDIGDNMSDAASLGQAVLYTEGEAGAVSGALDVTPPTPHGYVAPMRDRLVVGAIDTGSGYQVSQTALPNEPVAFTQPGVSGTPALVYRDSVEGRITAVAALDDTIVVATVDHIYLSGGDGPNLAGQGAFSSPARLPTDVGIFDWRSLLENSEGLYFLGSAAQMYLLPRGGGSPTRVQQPQTLWARGTVVGAGTDIQDDCSVWAIDTGSAGIAAVRDLSKSIWMRDSLPFRPIAFRAHQGVLYAVDTAGTVWQQSTSAFGDNGSVEVLQVTTGDVLALTGGIAGFGRFGAVELLGEYRSDAVILVEASYDSGKTFSTLGGGAFTVSGLAAGEAFQRQWYPSQQRAGKVRFRITMTPSSAAAEGCRLAGMAIYLVQSTGPTRLGSTKRK